jgi:hypothetical protein
MSVLGQIPLRSGSPHAVFGGEYGAFAACCAYAPTAHNEAHTIAIEILRI